MTNDEIRTGIIKAISDNPDEWITTREIWRVLHGFPTRGWPGPKRGSQPGYERVVKVINQMKREGVVLYDTMSVGTESRWKIGKIPHPVPTYTIWTSDGYNQWGTKYAGACPKCKSDIPTNMYGMGDCLVCGFERTRSRN